MNTRLRLPAVFMASCWLGMLGGCSLDFPIGAADSGDPPVHSDDPGEPDPSDSPSGSGGPSNTDSNDQVNSDHPEDMPPQNDEVPGDNDNDDPVTESPDLPLRPVHFADPLTVSVGEVDETTFRGGGIPEAVTVSDFDGDSVPDIAVACGPYYYDAEQGNVAFLLNNGDRTFELLMNYQLDFEPAAIVSGDFDRDGDVDVVAAGIAAGWLANSAVFLENQDGGFAAGISLDLGEAVRSLSLATADLDRDGLLDVVAANEYSDNLSILMGDDGSLFAPVINISLPDWICPCPVYPVGVTIGDFDRDGSQDLAVANAGPNTLSILLNDKHGRFADPKDSPLGIINPSSAPAALDADNDGNLDLAVANRLNDSVRVRGLRARCGVDRGRTADSSDSGRSQWRRHG
jgi:hypothetical protein